MKRSLIATIAAAGLIGLGAGTFAIAEGHKGKHGKKAERHAEMLQQFDANGDGKLDETEREAARLAKFAEIDADGSGSLTEEEIIAHRTAKMTERTSAHFAEHDTDGSGTISIEEFEAAHQARKTKMKEHREARKAEMLEKFDADGDGELSREERKAARDAGYGRKGMRPDGPPPAE